MGRNEMDPPLCGSAAMSHNEFPSSEPIWSCALSLRIIAPPRKPGTMPPYHPIVRGLCHDSAPVFLPVGGLGTPVAVYHAAHCLAQPMHDGTGNASQAHHAAAS